MSARILPRLALRQTRWAVQRRAQSSTSKTAEAASSTASKAKESASEYAGKAQQGLSRVTSSAGSALSGAASAAGKALSGIGGRTGAAIGFVQGLIPPAIYYARVVGELGKIVFRGRNMYPPTMETIQSYLAPLSHTFRSPSSVLSAAAPTAQTVVKNPQTMLARLRELDPSTLTSFGVIAAEVIGFFSVGEMIGRFHIVGYRGGHEEHH